MKHRVSLAFGIATCALVVSTLIAAEPRHRAAAQQAQAAADDPAAGLFTETCGKCHDGARITAMRRTSADWEDIIKKMIEKGAPGTEKDFETVYDYLLRHYGKPNINAAPPSEMVTILGRAISLTAQQPGPPGRGGGGRGRGGLPGATPEQIQAVTDMNTALTGQSTAVATARAELATVTFAAAKNVAGIAAAVEKLRAAELALASKRAEEFAKLQAGPNKLNPEQVKALVAAGGNAGGRGRGGRGGGM